MGIFGEFCGEKTVFRKVLLIVRRLYKIIMKTGSEFSGNLLIVA
jgi:hypothetical protein